jgi:cell wall-associated NlpC family hydrolase
VCREEESCAVPVSRTPRRHSRAVAALAVIVTMASLLVAPGLAAVADPPPNPTDSQIRSVQQQKNDLAAEVGRLSARVAQMQTQLSQLVAAGELAEQKLALAREKLEAATAAATKARDNVKKAQQSVVQAQRDFVGYVRASYMSGDVSGTTGTLLTADDPNVLLEQGTLQDYQSSHQLNAIGNLQRATVGKSNADAAAREAVQQQTQATNAAAAAQQQALAAVAAAKRQAVQLQATLAANQNQLQDAQVRLATLNNQRATFLAYQKEQARLAEIRRQKALAAARAAAAAAARARQSGGGGGGGGYVSPGAAGSWTASKGQQAANRALTQLGMPYIWSGGNASGPTTGGCTDPVASCGTLGFDCSGLVMYAWAQYPFVHYAATQYLQGSVHPSFSRLAPGDLLFWSSNGSVSGIHHVAIYIGGGNVVQAPESGDVVKITPMYQVSWGLFGATRPLT